MAKKLSIKKIWFLIPAISVLSACESTEPVAIDDFESVAGIETVTKYLSVHLSDPGGSASRADFNDFEEGLKTENEVKRVRFYFFDETGQPSKIANQNGTLTNYLDWVASNNSGEVEDNVDSGTDGSEGSGSSVEGDVNLDRDVNLHITLEVPKTENLPASIVAVTNYSDFGTPAAISLADLNKLTGNFDITKNRPDFVMSSSVYADAETDKLFEAVDITDKLFQFEDEANLNPVVIYVERANAKIRLKIGPELTGKTGNITLSDGTILYNTNVENNSLSSNEEDVDNKVYVKFLGWNVTSEPVKSFLLKNIDPEWENTGIFGSDIFNWTNPNLNRSFWAINPVMNYDTSGNSDYRFGTFSDAKTIKGFGLDEDVNYTYTHENAAEAKNKTTSHPTQVIVAAQLVNSKGEPWEVVEWASNYFTKDDLLMTLADFASVYEMIENIAQDPETGGDVKTTEYKKLDQNYFKFISALEAGRSADEAGRYDAYFRLDQEKVKDKKLAMAVEGEIKDVSEINTYLNNTLPPAKIWTNGYTYYYFTVPHIENSGNNDSASSVVYGIVRNHIYDASIKNLTSLGTPVFNENDVIIPEVPEDEQNFFSAQINVLNWRLVSKTFQLEW